MINDMRLNRIIASILSAALLLGATACSNETETVGKAKYVFLFIGDGMSLNAVLSTESYLSYKNDGTHESAELTMTQFPYFGVATTYSANRYVTDSAASGTAIACGVKTNNASIGVDADGEAANSVAYELKEEGYQIGIVTTVPINHATPSAFYAHSTNRYGYYDIARQIKDSGFEYFAGSGFMKLNGDNGECEPVDAYLEENGYTVCYGIEEFKQKSAGKDKVIFSQESNRGGAEDYVSSGKIAEDASLREMLQMGLDHIDENRPFFFMCEGGKIDWTAHAHKVMPMMMDIIEFDNAIALAHEFYLKHPEETLIIVTADHETGGMSLGGDHEQVDWKIVEEQWEKEGKHNNMSEEDNKAMNDKASIGWTSTHHTAGPVPVFAIGKGAEKFTGKLSNKDFKGKILCE